MVYTVINSSKLRVNWEHTWGVKGKAAKNKGHPAEARAKKK